MKKIFTLVLGVVCGYGGFAQRTHTTTAQDVQVAGGSAGSYSRTTASGATRVLKNITATDTIQVYRADTGAHGYATGINYWNDKAFAERYQVHDTDISIVGVMALFTGKVNPASTKSVTFSIWDVGPQTPVTGSIFYTGYPDNVLNSVSVPVTQLGIGPVIDTPKSFYFAAPIGGISGPFFAGYSIAYNFSDLNGDTLALASSKNGERSVAYTFSLNVSGVDTTLDTIYTVQNATQGSDNRWYDNYTQNDSLLNNLAIYPIVITGFKTGIAAVSRNGFTFYGAYPNPATDVTNIHIGLQATADVTVRIMDVAGHLVQATSYRQQNVGEHFLPVSLTSIAAGEYLYLVTTSAGEGAAGKFVKQ